MHMQYQHIDYNLYKGSQRILQTMIKYKKVGDPLSKRQKGAEKNAFCKAQTNKLHRQYQQTQHQILLLLNYQTKPIQIRLKEWLKKLQTVVEVQAWLRNRNLYCRVMLAMLHKNSLASPFHKQPPSTSIPMLSIYEVPFDIREQIEKKKDECEISITNDFESQKQNRNQANIELGMDGGLSYHRSRQRYSTKDKIIHKKSLQDPKNDGIVNIESQIRSNIRKSYDFLLKNKEKFINEEQINDLLEDLWNFTVYP